MEPAICQEWIHELIALCYSSVNIMFNGCLLLMFISPALSVFTDHCPMLCEVAVEKYSVQCSSICQNSRDCGDFLGKMCQIVTFYWDVGCMARSIEEQTKECNESLKYIEQWPDGSPAEWNEPQNDRNSGGGRENGGTPSYPTSPDPTGSPDLEQSNGTTSFPLGTQTSQLAADISSTNQLVNSSPAKNSTVPTIMPTQVPKENLLVTSSTISAITSKAMTSASLIPSTPTLGTTSTASISTSSTPRIGTTSTVASSSKTTTPSLITSTPSLGTTTRPIVTIDNDTTRPPSFPTSPNSTSTELSAAIKPANPSLSPLLHSLPSPQFDLPNPSTPSSTRNLANSPALPIEVRISQVPPSVKEKTTKEKTMSLDLKSSSTVTAATADRTDATSTNVPLKSDANSSTVPQLFNHSSTTLQNSTSTTIIPRRTLPKSHDPFPQSASSAKPSEESSAATLPISSKATSNTERQGHAPKTTTISPVLQIPSPSITADLLPIVSAKTPNTQPTTTIKKLHHTVPLIPTKPAQTQPTTINNQYTVPSHKPSKTTSKPEHIPAHLDTSDISPESPESSESPEEWDDFNATNSWTANGNQPESTENGGSWSAASPESPESASVEEPPIEDGTDLRRVLPPPEKPEKRPAGELFAEPLDEQPVDSTVVQEIQLPLRKGYRRPPSATKLIRKVPRNGS